MNNNEFSQLMDDIKIYYKPSSLSYEFDVKLNIKDKVLPHDVYSCIDNFRLDVDGCDSGQEKKLKDATDIYLKNNDSDNFKHRMGEIRDELKEETNKKIDNFFDEMKYLAENHLESQALIVETARNIYCFFSNSILDKINDFMKEMVNKISEWVEKTLDKIDDSFNDRSKDVCDFFTQYSHN